MQFEPVFRNRTHAGEVLASLVVHSFRDHAVGARDILVLGLARGGVPIAAEVARALGAELDVFLVRKLGLPAQKELAIGAIASGGIRVLNGSIISELHLPAKLIDQVAAREEHELKHREGLYRQGRPAAAVDGRAVVLVDDGLATGASMKAAVQAVRPQSPKRLIVAVPVAARESCAELQQLVDWVVCAHTPESFNAVGVWYEDFSQTTDQQVRQLLKEADRQAHEYADAECREQLP